MAGRVGWVGGGCERDAAAAGDLLPQSGRAKLPPVPDAAPETVSLCNIYQDCKKCAEKMS